ncbi:MAG: hypothetical protein LQ344_004468 [Seirophora lacunosa]|nr:MAG: hypothetical protein LQ344_004468 [Seirophora lacunosa]
MAVKTESSTFHAMEQDKAIPTTLEKTSTAAESAYWWNTSGQDLTRMLQEADYSQDVRHQFLSYYRDVICPRLGNRPDDGSVKSGVGRDGNPFEYSFELKGTTKKQAVRFVVDVSELRPADRNNPLGIATSQQVVDSLAERSPGFDDTWYRSLSLWFVKSNLSMEEQQALIAEVGYQTSVILGFDIHHRVSSPQHLPVLGKVYFPPCFVAAATGITRWQAARLAIRQLPGIDTYPNILRSLEKIEEYLSTKPKDWEEGVRYLATDFLAPGKARLKLYMRYAGDSFDDIWDYYTLGGRITGLEDDKEKFRDLITQTCGGNHMTDRWAQEPRDQRSVAPVARKATAIYMSLSADNACPTPKICIYPANYAKNDEMIARGLDSWLRKQQWDDSEGTLEKQVKRVL